jgi:(2R)-3-sulfolactate dehydrogenase (NADP+)
MLIHHLQLEQLAGSALRRAGASESMALCTARCLVAGDLQGLATHGVARIPTYCAHLRSGRVRGEARPVIASDKAAACLIDAGNGLAFEACALAIEQAQRRAERHGVSIAAVTNSHHCGALGILIEPLATAGMIGIAFSNAPAGIMPWGGKRPLLGTNPIAAIFPRRTAPAIVIDMSLTQVTRGQIMLLAKAGKPIPEGWGMDAAGEPTTDPEKILHGGSLYAVGGLKGTMLALMVEILCCALSGAALSSEMASLHLASGPVMRFGQLFMAIDPRALAGRDTYLERVETLVNAMLADDGVRLPGARREETRLRAMREGVEMDDALYREIRVLAGEEV